MIAPLILRAAQREFIRGMERYRLCAFVARRQFGKTTTFATIALKKMMQKRDHTVVFGSAKLSLAREVVRKESQILQRAIGALASEAQGEGLLRVADAGTGKMPARLSEDDFAELFEAQRLEFRFYHSRTSYSRTKVVALLPDTVGETGDLMCDEIGRVRNWREVWEAVEPIVSSNPEFRVTLSTTPPPDDTHFSFEMLAPPLGTEFAVSKTGNWYQSEMGVMVLRVDAYDAYADGVAVFDLKSGEALTPEEHRRRAFDRVAWDRNYGVKFVVGGTAACGLMLLDTAQRRGVGECGLFLVEDDGDLGPALDFLRGRLGPGPVGLGWDLATTEQQTSNPSALAVVEGKGIERIVRAVVVWKTRDPELAVERVRLVMRAVEGRKEGGRARRLCVDATNERYFATMVQRDLRGQLPVELVVASEGWRGPGLQEPISMKAYLGTLLVGELEDNHLWVPPERYLREDWRLVKRDRGSFACDVGPDGQHGDTFDAAKLGIYALTRGSGEPWAQAVSMGEWEALGT